MFNGEKKTLFWLGLIVLAFASIILFSSLWQFAFIQWYQTTSEMLRYSGPYIVGAIVFILIGLYMMKSGVKKP